MGILTSNTPADPEADRLQELCSIVDLGLKQFPRVGLALEEIRDRELYRRDAETFADFCRDRWKMTPQHANRLIAAAALCRELGDLGDFVQNERQARELKKVPPELRAEALTQQIQTGTAPSDYLRNLTPMGSKSNKPIRIRVPGAIIVIEPNRKFTDAQTVLHYALEKLAAKAA